MFNRKIVKRISAIIIIVLIVAMVATGILPYVIQ